VLIQLFERRTLTYTPANPSGFQVEMGNVGQHYYSWRYGINSADTMPGNFRLILPQAKSLYSYSVRAATGFKLGDAPDYIAGVWPSEQGQAIIKTTPTSFGPCTSLHT
jgi:hypothetical protein